MVAMFFSQRIISGTTEYKAVPASLREQVDAILIESGVEFLMRSNERTQVVRNFYTSGVAGGIILLKR